jgi:hypothetical protein
MSHLLWHWKSHLWPWTSHLWPWTSHAWHWTSHLWYWTTYLWHWTLSLWHWVLFSDTEMSLVTSECPFWCWGLICGTHYSLVLLESLFSHLRNHNAREITMPARCYPKERSRSFSHFAFLFSGEFEDLVLTSLWSLRTTCQVHLNCAGSGSAHLEWIHKGSRLIFSTAKCEFRKMELPIFQSHNIVGWVSICRMAATWPFSVLESKQQGLDSSIWYAHSFLSTTKPSAPVFLIFMEGTEIWRAGYCTLTIKRFS